MAGKRGNTAGYSFEDERRYLFTCCCGSFHAESGAFALAIALTTTGVFGALSEPWDERNVAGCLSVVAVCVAIFLAKQYRRAYLYLPFLILEVLNVVCCLLLAGVMLAVALAPAGTFGSDDELLKEEEPAVILSSAGILCAFAALHACQFRIVYLAFEFMKLQNEQYNPV